MPESTLSIPWAELQQTVGSFLGWGYGAALNDTAWSALQVIEIDKVIKGGLRQFYNPPLIPGEANTHDWSFLKPLASLVFASGTSAVNLPDDFGGIEGKVAVTDAAGDALDNIRVKNPQEVSTLLQQNPSQMGYPQCCGLNWIKGTGDVAGQRAQLLIYPAADKRYTLTLQYYLLSDYLNATHPYAYGGMLHTETIKESCLSIAEEMLENTQGVHKAKFMERLAASISADRRMKPQTGGYNGDKSDYRDEDLRRGFQPWYSTVTYTGS